MRTALALLLVSFALPAFFALPALALPTVIVGTAMGSTEADIDTALRACRTGCILSFPAGTWTGVGFTLGAGLRAGIEVKGAGQEQTILQAPIPQLVPVITVSVVGATPKPLIHDLTIDGQAALQTAASWAARNPGGWGIAVDNGAGNGTMAPPGRIYSVEVKNEYSAGIVLRVADSWEVDHDNVHDIGCSSVRRCPSLGAPNDAHSGIPYSQGFGIWCLDEKSPNCNIHDNTVTSVSKHGIEAFQDGGHGPAPRPHIYHNTITLASRGGIALNGTTDAEVENNTIRAIGGTAEDNFPGSSDGFGILCNTTSLSPTLMGNAVTGTHGPAIVCTGSGGSYRIISNTTTGDCLDNRGANFAEFAIGPDTLTAGALATISGNVATRAPSGAGCQIGLMISGLSKVDVWQGSYAAGLLLAPLAGVYLQTSTNITFHGPIYIDGGGGVGLQFHDDPQLANVIIGPDTTVYHPSAAGHSGANPPGLSYNAMETRQPSPIAPVVRP